MMPSAYLETSFIGYLTSRPSADLLVAAHQVSTRRWWDIRRKDFTVYISEPILEEISRGDPTAARERMDIAARLPRLAVNPEALQLAGVLIQRKAIPKRSVVDALHVAVATIYSIDYLLTWNMRHMANAEARRTVTRLVLDLGYNPVVICTPEELMEP